MSSNTSLTQLKKVPLVWQKGFDADLNMSLKPHGLWELGYVHFQSATSTISLKAHPKKTHGIVSKDRKHYLNIAIKIVDLPIKHGDVP